MTGHKQTLPAPQASAPPVPERLRALARQRLGLALVAPPEDQLPLALEHLAKIDHQVPMLIRRQ